MATKIPTEILIKILNNVQSFRSTKDLYSSLLVVNRIWCKMIRSRGRKHYVFKLIRISYRLGLTQNGFDLSSSPLQATFDYPSFTHKFIIDNLVNFISIYSKQIISSDRDINNKNNNKNELRILFRVICKLIINRCSFLDYFSLRRVENFRHYSGLIDSILELPGAQKAFKKLKNFTSMRGNNDLIFPSYQSSRLICHNILNMDLFLYSYSQLQLFSKLISVQKSLEDIFIDASNYPCN
ncbi:4501_t:CDS:2 [Diversispora eburnea]|uniref:4501_t:CDS:1 n=1 Tax=Diversispora eburnea TaxID=1213867 RepID=A0A9N9BK21_9GLOM|nr:4501_t:CDS:2 [Diversispora eburnea]